MEKFAIFDLDGTLLNTIEDIANACNYALNKQGFPIHSVNPYRYFIGSGVMNLIKMALPEASRNDETAILLKKDYDEYYSIHAKDNTSPYPGILKTLKKLNEAGVGMAVLSNKPHLSTLELVDIYFPGLFNVVFGQRDGIPHKPDPGTVYEIIKLMNATKSKGFYIGDTSIDIETGKNAELVTVGVLWGFRTKEELISSGADFTISSPEDLLEIILAHSSIVE